MHPRSTVWHSAFNTATPGSGVTAHDLAEATEVPVETVKDVLATMADTGWLVEADGVYYAARPPDLQQPEITTPARR